MNEKLIDLIKGRGYWRINFRPIALPSPEHSLTECQDVIQRTAVRLRGWDYPHIPSSFNESQGIDRLETCIQAWSSWSWHLEFWRLYTSEQFLHYTANSEDWRHENSNILEAPPKSPESLRIGLTDSIWLIAEVFEFLARLGQQGFYKNGVQASIQLRNVRDRELYVDEPMRVPFATHKVTQAEQIEFAKVLSASEIQQPKPLASAALRHIYDRFDWQPNPSILESDIKGYTLSAEIKLSCRD